MRVCEQIFHRITIYKFMFYHTGTDSTTFLKVRVVRWGNRFKCANNVFPKVKLEAQTNIRIRIAVRFYRARTLVGFSIFWNSLFSLFAALSHCSRRQRHLIFVEFSILKWLNEWMSEWVSVYVVDCMHCIWIVHSRFSNIHTQTWSQMISGACDFLSSKIQ